MSTSRFLLPVPSVTMSTGFSPCKTDSVLAILAGSTPNASMPYNSLIVDLIHAIEGAYKYRKD